MAPPFCPETGKADREPRPRAAIEPARGATPDGTLQSRGPAPASPASLPRNDPGLPVVGSTGNAGPGMRISRPCPERPPPFPWRSCFRTVFLREPAVYSCPEGRPGARGHGAASADIRPCSRCRLRLTWNSTSQGKPDRCGASDACFRQAANSGGRTAPGRPPSGSLACFAAALLPSPQAGATLLSEGTVRGTWTCIGPVAAARQDGSLSGRRMARTPPPDVARPETERPGRRSPA